jgi:hypothetical protein
MNLDTKIIAAKRTATPRYGMAADGYTLRSGAPTSVMVLLEGEKRWRRIMVWQFSNVGTCFLRIKGNDVIVSEYQIPGV